MIAKLVLQTFIWFGVMGALFFLSAGTFAWPGAWVYLVVMVGLSFTLGMTLAQRDPGLMNERLRSPIQKNPTGADKVLLSTLLIGIFGWQIFMGFDFRFGWSPVPVWAQVVGALLGKGETDESATVASHEIDGFGCNVLRGQGKVAFVFAVFIVDNDNHASGADFGDGAGNVSEWRLEGARAFRHGRQIHSR